MRTAKMVIRRFTATVAASIVFFEAVALCYAQSSILTFDTFRVECLRKIEVAAQADGLIADMEVEEGTYVPSGELLFRIDNRVAQAQLEVAEKELESAEMQAKQDADIKFAKATYAVALAESESERELLKKNATTLALVRRKDLERDKASLQIEVAEVKRQTDQLAVNVAEAKRNAAVVQLGLYDIRAPWDAIVNERMKDKGAWIRAGEPVLKIHHMEEMRVVGFINIRDLRNRGLSLSSLEGAPIRIIIDVSPTQQHSVDSQIQFVSSDIDDSNNVRVWARIKNQRLGNSWLLRDGLQASVTIAVQ
jgi:multidrug resistance efflux pump